MMKGKSILEASIVFTVFMVVTTIIPGVRSLIRWEGRTIGGSYFTGILMVVLSIVASILTKLDFEEVGIKTGDWKKSLNMGFKGFLSLLIPQSILTLYWAWGLDYRNYWQIALLQSILIIVVTYLLIRNIGKNKSDISSFRIILVVVILLTPLIMGFKLGTLSIRLLTTFIWQIIVGGFSEEILFRGYIQSTVNREYGTNWRISGVRFGPGLLLSSLLYGLSRGLRTMNFGWTVYTFILGLFYGMIREASGDIIGPGSTNAIIDGAGVTFIKVLR